LTVLRFARDPSDTVETRTDSAFWRYEARIRLITYHRRLMLRPIRANRLTPAEPAVATLLGVTVLGERLTALSWCDLRLLGIGLVLLTLPRRHP